jgi:hydroxymethylpyrimidine pyrophosphatase-like HAD family hydrolase
MIGDGDNDIGVLGVVGLPIAMGNATDAVKAAATHVVGNVDEDGFAEAITYALRPAADRPRKRGASPCGT